jgi:hypothetical protein
LVEEVRGEGDDERSGDDELDQVRGSQSSS